MLHHCVTVTLILFSMMSNQVAAGVIIVIVHDASSVFSSGGRAYLESKFVSRLGMQATFFFMIASWTYLRSIVFPFCLLAQTWANRPLQDSFYSIINF